MTPQSTHKIIKAQLPEPYFGLIQKYIQPNKQALTLPEAIKITVPWYPGGAEEGYYFWDAVYQWSLGKIKDLPRISRMEASQYLHSYDGKRNNCRMDVDIAAKIIEDLFGKIGLSRRNASSGEYNIFKRHLLFSHLIRIGLESYSLEIIGELVAMRLGRSRSFDHSTVIHARRMDKELTESNDVTYVKMKALFNKRFDELYSNNDNN